MIIVIFQGIITVLILMGIGFFGKHLGILKKEDILTFNKLLVNISIPCLTFTAVRSAELSKELFLFPAYAILLMMSMGAIAFLLCWPLKLPKPLLGTIILTSMLGNTGFMGYPVIANVFGSEHLVKAVFYNELGTALFMFTIGSLIAAYLGKGMVNITAILRNLFTFPPFLAILFVFATKSLPFAVAFLTAANYLGQLTIPLVMITVGLSMDFSQIKQGSKPVFIALFLKLLISPGLAFLFAKGAGFLPVNTGILVLEAGMPVATIAFSIALRYGLDIKTMSNIIFTSVIISIVTLPFLGLFL